MAKLHQKRYEDHGPTLVCQMLVEHRGVKLSPDTLSAGLAARRLGHAEAEA